MIFILGLAGIVTPARASLSFNIGSSGQTTFDSSTSGLTATEIDLLTLTATADGFEDSGTGVLFQDGDGGTSGLQTISSCTSSCPDGGMQGINGNFSINIVIPSMYTAVSFNLLYNSVSGAGSSVTVSATGFSSQPLTTESAPQFVGAISSSGISGLAITGEQETFEIDDVVVYSQGSSSAAPDAPTLLLLGTGLVLLGSFRFRRRRAATLS